MFSWECATAACMLAHTNHGVAVVGPFKGFLTHWESPLGKHPFFLFF